MHAARCSSQHAERLAAAVVEHGVPRVAGTPRGSRGRAGRTRRPSSSRRRSRASARSERPAHDEQQPELLEAWPCGAAADVPFVAFGRAMGAAEGGGRPADGRVYHRPDGPPQTRVPDPQRRRRCRRALERKLEREGRPLRVKLGLDPTAPDIHLGHTVVLQKLREFQDLGHVVVLIVGDYTARVGDPSGRSATRPLLSGEEIDANARTYQEQAFKVARPRAASRCASTPSGSTCAWRSSSASRARPPSPRSSSATTSPSATPRASPISVLELLYPLMQGYDSVAVRSDVELGGTDQTFNLLLGRDVQRAYGQPEQVVAHDADPARASTASGRCRSRSATTSASPRRPRRCTGKTMRIPDAAMEQLVPAAARRGRRPPAPSARDAKHALARSARGALPRRGGRRRGRGALRRASSSRATSPRRSTRSRCPRGGPVHLPAVIAEHFGGSRSEARRLLAQGARAPRRRAAGGGDLDLPRERLDGARRCRSGGASSAACASRRRRSADIEACGACAIFVGRPARWSCAGSPGSARSVLSGRSVPQSLGGSARRREGVPSTSGATVFENSTACAPRISRDPCVRPGLTPRESEGRMSQ